jgi:hypothetical protein
VAPLCEGESFGSLLSGRCEVRSNVCQEVAMLICHTKARVLVACHDVSLVKQFLCGHRNGVYLELGNGDTGDACNHEQRWKVTR